MPTPETFKLLVCGDREWTNRKLIRDTMLDMIEQRFKLGRGVYTRDFDRVEVIEGEARGADTIGREIAEELGLKVTKVFADWPRYGKRAGPVRNREMLDLDPHLVLAFHNDIDASKGTRDCVTEAKRRGILVHVITETT